MENRVHSTQICKSQTCLQVQPFRQKPMMKSSNGNSHSTPKIPLIPIKSTNNIPLFRDTPAFKVHSNHQNNQNPKSQIDSLNQFSDSPEKSISIIRKVQQSLLEQYQVETKVSTSALSSCVEPFRTNKSQTLYNKSGTNVNYENKIEILLIEQDKLVQSYNDKILFLEQKLETLQKENCILNEQVTQVAVENASLHQRCQSLSNQGKQDNDKQVEQLVRNLDSLIEINKTYEYQIQELQSKIDSICQSKDQENDAYFSQISIYKQKINALEQQIEEQKKMQQNYINQIQQLQLQIQEQQKKSRSTSLKSNKQNNQDDNLIIQLENQKILLQETQNQLEIQKIKNENHQQQLSTLQNDLNNKVIEIEQLNGTVKSIRKEKAKLSMKLMQTGMANLMLIAQQQE